jgi:hypothetical protein
MNKKIIVGLIPFGVFIFGIGFCLYIVGQTFYDNTKKVILK